MSRIFGGTWTFLAHASELPNPNDFVRKRLGLRPIIVTRDREGKFHGLLNRCTHRGATICRQDEGNARRFTCPYHNWSFTNTGELAAVPMEDGYGPSFDKSELGLGKLRVESYRGFIFGTFNNDLPDLKIHLGPAAALLDEWLDRWPGAELQLRRGQHKLMCAGNWKLIYDNAADGYHPGFSHASLLRMRKDRYGGGVDMQWALGNVDDGLQTVSDSGNGGTFIDQRAEITRYWDQSAPMPGEDTYARVIRERLGEKGEAALDVVMGSGMNLNIFPNLLIIGNQIQVLEPQSVNQTHINWYATALVADDLPDEVNSLRMRLQEDFPSFGEPDDLANFEECQAGLEIEEVAWVQTGRHLDTGREYIGAKGMLTGPVSDELPLRVFWQEWLKRMEYGNAWVAK
ncbi:aromatic ring-hydroxylating dioxygenase subunit alpha (plasmid) [Shinella sp. H4-D48]|uniref:aromatic ring-hydroxylating dioxygenase subunit alpha n=1 Tax=Shinella sp. H4-D48 TaxID=2925841 RepID=UPI001F52D5D7|nr:aromatic ring-hydroxylating dioxygenase subunit alpha [Shinella sp. H4-D48]UNK39969.1 aromatic ring-hydroxylating dioxygenase subunit alpha [Shinella sp. H4-D48]